MYFYPATCAAWLFLFAGTVLAIAEEAAFPPHGILFPALTSEQEAKAAPLNTILIEGWKLTPVEAIKLETALAQNPGNMPMRLRLISYYCQHTFQERRVRHVFELIKTHPDADVFQDADLIIRISPRDPASNRPADYVRAKALWQQQVGRFASNAKVLSNAATAVSSGDPALALQWIKAAQSSEPTNGEWTRWLAKIYAGAIRSSFWDGKSAMIFTGDAEDFRHSPFELPSSMRESVKREMETSADAVLVEAVGGALLREVRLLREKSGSGSKRFSLITPELQQTSKFGERLLGRVRRTLQN